MDLSSILMFVAAIGFFGVTIYAANDDDLKQRPFTLTRYFLFGGSLILFLVGLTLSQFWLFSLMQTEPASAAALGVGEIDPGAAALATLLCIASAIASYGIASSPRVRLRVASWVGQGHYRPESAVHAAAIVLSLLVVCINLVQLVLSGGLDGLAESVEGGSSIVSSTIFQQLLWMFASLLGIGLFIRRDWKSALERLSLRVPTADDLFGGVSVAGLMLVLVFALSAVWSTLVDPELFEQQTAASSQIAQAFNTIPVALLLSLAIAIGEEVFFRGAIQPIFGIGLTSVFFTLLHTQYTLTPASIGILILSVALGWLRNRQSTTAAVIAHFIYNFTQLALAIMAGNLLGGSA